MPIGEVMNSDCLDLLRNALPAQGFFPACYAFSIHKSGSTLMHSMVGAACKQMGIPAISIPDLLFREGIAEKAWNDDERMVELFCDGRVYYGFRMLPGLLLNPEIRLRERKSVLLVRDPRDALVSQYFSYGGKHISHRLPDKNAEQFIESAKATSALDIDTYAIQAAPGYLTKLEAYRSALDFENVMLRRYEDVYFDKRSFLAAIFAQFGLAIRDQVLDDVAASHDIRPATEQVGQHIRKGAPGDHRDKLKPETIKRLNDLFSGTCRDFGYELDG